MQSFYVYVYRDPRPHRLGRPFYVGKGTDKRSDGCRKRASAHWMGMCTNATLQLELSKIAAMELEPIIETVGIFDDEEDAFLSEMELIAEYGRRNLGTGPLCNRTPGGEGRSGLKYSEQRLLRVRAMFNTPEMKKMASDRSRANWDDPEMRQRIIDSIQKTAKCPEYRAKLRIAIKASRTPELRSIIGEASRKNWQDPDYREKRAVAQREALMTPEEKSRKSEATKASWRKNGDKMRAAITAAKRTPEHRAAVGKRSKAYYEGNEEARRMSGEYAKAYNTPEVRAEKARIMKERWADPEYRARMMAKRAAKRNPSEPLNP